MVPHQDYKPGQKDFNAMDIDRMQEHRPSIKCYKYQKMDNMMKDCCYEIALLYDSILSYLWPYFFLPVALSLSLHLIFDLIGSYLIWRLYSILEGHFLSYRYLVLWTLL